MQAQEKISLQKQMKNPRYRWHNAHRSKPIQNHSKQFKPHSNPSAPILLCLLLFLFLFLFLSPSLRKKIFSQLCFLTGVYRWSAPSGVSEYEVFKPKSRPFYTVGMPTDGATLLWYSGARRWHYYLFNPSTFWTEYI